MSTRYDILESGPSAQRRPPWLWVFLVLAVAFISATAAGVVLIVVHRAPGPGTAPPAAGTDGQAQAAAIDALLNASGASRTQLGPAVAQIEGCTNLDAAATTLQQIVSDRDAEVRRGRSLAVDRLDNGDQLRTLLVQALTYSLQADRDFAKWLANTQTNGCTGGHATHDSDYAAAQTASAGATTSKQSFVGLWNPVADRYGLPPRTDTGF